jgi:hypothetical protein
VFEEALAGRRITALRMLEARVEAARRLAGRTASEVQPSAASQLDPTTRARQKELLEQEIALVEGQLKEVRKQVELGVVATSEPIAKQRELIHLQRKVAALDDLSDSIRRQRQLIDQELGLVRQLVDETKRRIDNGKATRHDLVELERQMLQLMREDLDLTAKPDQRTATGHDAWIRRGRSRDTTGARSPDLRCDLSAYRRCADA